MSGRNSQISRILTILDLLERNPLGFTIAEIWEKTTDRGHDSGKRTIYRDLEALSQAGFPLFPEGEGEATQRWRLEHNKKINGYLVLSARELFALFLSRGALTPLRDTPFFDDIEGIFSKLQDKLGAKQSDYLDSLDSELKFQPGPQWGLGLNPDVLETVRAGCAESQVVECTYFSVNSKAESKRRLGPHYMYYARGGLYLVAEDLSDKKVKVFALPRMKEAELLDESYQGKVATPENFFEGALSVYTGNGVSEVVIEFDASASQYVKERRWHSTQRITNLEGGKVRVTLEVAETPELSAWILGFGPSAKVTSPETLASKIIELASDIIKIYQRKTS